MTDYFTEHDDILENLLGITDPERLKKVESDIVSIRMFDIAQKPTKGNFDFTHLKAIHKYLFGDIYPFAGKLRTVNIAKPGSAFCYAENIEPMQTEIFGKLKKDNLLKGLNKTNFINKLADFAGDLNALHPFREGNGRANRIFLAQLADNAGYALTYGKAANEEILQADISAFHGNMEPIKTLFHKIIEKI